MLFLQQPGLLLWHDLIPGLGTYRRHGLDQKIKKNIKKSDTKDYHLHKIPVKAKTTRESRQAVARVGVWEAWYERELWGLKVTLCIVLVMVVKQLYVC